MKIKEETKEKQRIDFRRESDHFSVVLMGETMGRWDGEQDKEEEGEGK